jgi:hypothetical protein
MTSIYYVEDGLSWKNAIEKFYDFSKKDPDQLVVGQSFVSLTTSNGYVKNYIYTCLQIKPTITYKESTPMKKWAIYDKETKIEYVFNQDNVWSPL